VPHYAKKQVFFTQDDAKNKKMPDVENDFTVNALSQVVNQNNLNQKVDIKKKLL
jgi:hypothetical protein